MMLVLVGSGGCQKSEDRNSIRNQPEFHSLPLLLQTVYQLHGNPSNQAIIYSIEGYINDRIAEVALKREPAKLSEQDKQVLRIVRRYWIQYPPEHPDTPYGELHWQQAQRFVESIPPAETTNARQYPARPAIVNGYTPRMLKLACSDSTSGKPITNFAVAIGGPAMFVSLYPSRTNVDVMECRFVRMGAPGQLISAGTNDPYPVQFTIQSSNYVSAAFSISTGEIVGSNALARAVLLSPK